MAAQDSRLKFTRIFSNPELHAAPDEPPLSPAQRIKADRELDLRHIFSNPELHTPSEGSAAQRIKADMAGTPTGGEELHAAWIVARTLTGRSITLDLADGLEDTVDVIKAQLHAKTGTLPQHMRLIFNGRTLKRAQTLEECGVTHNAVVHVVNSGCFGNQAALAAAYESREIDE